MKIESALLTFWFCLFAKNALAQCPTSNVVRLSVVNTPGYSGLMKHLLKDFDHKVEVTSTSQIFRMAKDGEADAVIAHYGKGKDGGGFENHVGSGLLLWPKMVFANQSALIGPTSDPATSKGKGTVASAFKAIARTKSTYVLNQIDGIQYLNETSWAIEGIHKKGSWYINDKSIAKSKAADVANEKHAYFMWGAFPFLRWKAAKEKAGQEVNLKLIVTKDPILQRTMAVSIVDPNNSDCVNYEGALALQKYLLLPQTQAKVAKFRSMGVDLQLWWPAGNEN